MNDIYTNNSLANYTNSNSLIYGSYDYHNLGILNSCDNMSLIMDASVASFSTQDSDFSTGYLEDALSLFGESSKRRRLLPYTTDDDIHDGQSKSTTTSIDDFDKNFWNFNPIWHQPVENFYCMDQIERFCGFSDTHISTMRSRTNEEPNIVQEETKTTESPNSSTSSYKESLIPPITCSKNKNKKVESMRRRNRVVLYPFALVKAGGEEGDVTLNEINERMLMAPRRAVRHPVGEYACRPCVSAKGSGLSGKPVVALTTIHTQGRRGTITIIRTKG